MQRVLINAFPLSF
uniref:Uncharacterized protein n=1 Tax=Rhizophora mucronata TaxID=61149 RepID=A0A2P2QYZ3_RHIMU